MKGTNSSRYCVHFHEIIGNDLVLKSLHIIGESQERQDCLLRRHVITCLRSFFLIFGLNFLTFVLFHSICAEVPFHEWPLLRETNTAEVDHGEFILNDTTDPGPALGFGRRRSETGQQLGARKLHI